MSDELTKALLLEEVVPPREFAEALFASVKEGVPLVQALVDKKAVSADVLGRYLERSDAPFLRQVAAVTELVDRLPHGLCARLLAIPVRRDAITGTVDVVVPDPGDWHAAHEVAFHLGAPVRLVRAPLSAIDDALRKLRHRGPGGDMPASRPSALPPPLRPPLRSDDERIYDSRPRAHGPSTAGLGIDDIDPAALRPSRVPVVEPRQAHVVPSPSAAPPAMSRRGRDTPPWGTPVHTATTPGSEIPASGLGSEIPIPLTRRTYASERGGTQRPPPPVDPSDAGLGEGIPLDPEQLRNVVEVRSANTANTDIDGLRPDGLLASPMASFIPGPPPVPTVAKFAAYAPQIPFADVGGILAALRAASGRDEVLELLLTGARSVAARVALFVVKRGGYLGWSCTPEFGDRTALQGVLIPLDAASIFDEAVHEGLYLGPIRHDELHMPLHTVMRHASRDVALVPIRVSGRTAVMIVADDLGDTMLATRRLEELAMAAGEAFARIVRQKR
ncbi:MAG: hypothetical protein JST00_03880 [Deltaproteobacteria bacterium]|nr:hypothetical protein [Deltaproteobacteria bacterium]